MAAMHSTTSLATVPVGIRTGHSSVDPTELEKMATAQQQQQPLLQQPASPMFPPSPGRPGGPPGPPGMGPPGMGPPGPSQFQPRSFKFWATLVCNFMALFLVALDRTIIATAVPTISNEFKALGDIGWYGSAYMLTTACAQLIYGRIYKFYDMKWTFIISIIIFEIGSTICGAATSSPMFIGGRAIAGAASAGIFSGTMLIMIPMIPLHRRPAFQGIFGMVFGVASVMGPLVGGGFTSGASWRWCFYINLPIGGVTMIFMMLFWKPPKQMRPPVSFMGHVKRLDPIGMFFFLPGCVSLLLALQWGGSTYPWDHWRIVMLFGVAVAATIAFISVQIMKPETAMIPPKVITQRSVAFGVSFTFFLAGSMLLMIYFVPIWFQTVREVSPFQSGINTLPLVLSLVISSILSGTITQKMGYYVPSMLIAPSIMSIGEGLMTTFSTTTPTSQWVAYQFLSGFGLGFGMQASGLAIQTVLPKEDVSTGIAINFFLQQLGGAISTSVGQAILSNFLQESVKQIPGFDSSQLMKEGATALFRKVPAEFRHLVIGGYNFGCQRIFLAATCMAFAALLCALGMEWKSIKKGKNGQGPPGGPGGPPGGPNGPPGSVMEMKPPMERRNSLSMNKPQSRGYDTNSHSSTGVIGHDGPGSHYSMMSLPGNHPGHYSIVGMPSSMHPNSSQVSLPAGFESNNPYNAISAPVVYMQHTGDPSNPYGPAPMYGESGMVPVPVVYMDPAQYAATMGQMMPGGDGHRDSICGNCRCSMAAAGPVMMHHTAASSSTSLHIEDEKREGRSDAGSRSGDHQDHR